MVDANRIIRDSKELLAQPSPAPLLFQDVEAQQEMAEIRALQKQALILFIERLEYLQSCGQ